MCDGDSNISCESAVHAEKQSPANCVTDAGIETVVSEVQEKKAMVSIRFSTEVGSNVRDASERQLEKHFTPRTSTVAGMHIA
jgi:hypothetical protein